MFTGGWVFPFLTPEVSEWGLQIKKRKRHNGKIGVLTLAPHLTWKQREL